MSEQTKDPRMQDQQTNTTTPTAAPGIRERVGDTTVPVSAMDPVIELDVNPGPPPRPRYPEPTELTEKELTEKEVIGKTL